MPMVSLYRLHTDALEQDKGKLKEIADHINTCYPELKVYIYDIERNSSEVEDIYEKPHEPDCDCGQCSGEDRAIEQMEKGIVKAENSFGDD